jgi:hypothetical protein
MQTLKERYEHKRLNLLAEDVSKQNLELSSKYQALLTKMSNFGIFKEKIPEWKDAIKEKFLQAKDLDPSELKEKIFRGKVGEAISVIHQLHSASKNFKSLIVSILLDGDEEKFKDLDLKQELINFPDAKKKQMFIKGLVRAFEEENSSFRKLKFWKQPNSQAMAYAVMNLTPEKFLEIENMFKNNSPPDPTVITPPTSSTTPSGSPGAPGAPSSTASPKDAMKKRLEIWKQLAPSFGMNIGKDPKSLKKNLNKPEGARLMKIIRTLQEKGLLKEALRRGAIKLDIINEFKDRQ